VILCCRRTAASVLWLAPAVGVVMADEVRTKAGIVEGFTEPDGLVRVFRGIPFAAPPVGDLRWREPQPVAPWPGVRKATAFGARCLQGRIFDDMVFRDEPSEDCLPKDPNDIYAAGEQSRVPLLAGSNADEVRAGEIEYVFGALDSLPNVPWEEADRRLSDLMMAYWTNFARTGDPNGPGLPPWPRYTGEGGFPVMHLDVTSRARPDALRARYETLDAVMIGPRRDAAPPPTAGPAKVSPK